MDNMLFASVIKSIFRQKSCDILIEEMKITLEITFIRGDM